MSKEYTYVVEEWSTDSRRYTISSDRKLTENQLQDAYKEVGIPEQGYSETFDELPYCNTKVNFKVYYDGTDYGDDGQMEIVQGGENLKDE